MNNKPFNPLLKQLISEIAKKANEGRVSDLSWNAIYEAKKKKVKEADDAKKPAASGGDKKGEGLPPLGGAPAPSAAPAPSGGAAPAPAPAGGADSTGGGLPPLGGGGGEKGGGLPPLGGDDKGGGDAAPSDDKGKGAEKPDASGGEDTEDAEAVKTKAAAAKAAAEKEKAEKQIQDDSYVNLKSGSGVQFMLSKVLDHAYKTNTIDSLAGEMVQKLNIRTPQDLAAFSKDTAQYRVILGMPELIAAMKTMATNQPKTSSETAKD